MSAMSVLLGVLAGTIVLVLLVSFVCFLLTFYSSNKSTTQEYPLPPGEIYLPYRDTMVAWMKEARTLPYERLSVTSFDGLTLRGRYYEYAPGAPIELMMPGYRGLAERDLCGGVQRCFAMGRSALIVDQRGCGDSDGHVITFGVREHRDCLTWLQLLIDRFGKDVRVYLTGISMGAATVMIAAGQDLPPQVIGVVADCGFTSAKDIIKKVIRQLHLPADLLYPFVRLGALLYGGFDPEAVSPIESLKHCRVPICFAHGDADDYVPHEMSVRNYAVCTAPKTLFTAKGAGHGLSYLAASERYIQALKGNE